MAPKVCDGKTFPGLEPEGDLPLKVGGDTSKRLGGRGGYARKALTYHIPYTLVEYVCVLESRETVIVEMVHASQHMNPPRKVKGVNGPPWTLNPNCGFVTWKKPDV